MLFRFRARNYPNILSAEEEVRWNSYRMDRWNGGRAIKDILEKLKKMKENSETPYLGDLVNYIGDISDGVL